MRLSRIIMAIAVGLAVAAVPTAAGAALSQPQPPPASPTGPAQPPYQPAPPSLTVSPSTVTVGETATVTGTGFLPHELVEITITTNPIAAGVRGAEQSARRGDGSTVAMAAVAYQREDAPQPGGGKDGPEHGPDRGPRDGPRDCSTQTFTVRADARGSFTFTFRPRCPGTVTISARGLESGRTATAVLTVLGGKGGHHPPRLPVTGSSMSTPLKVGGGLVGAGAVMLLTTFAWRRRGRFGSGAAS